MEKDFDPTQFTKMIETINANDTKKPPLRKMFCIEGPARVENLDNFVKCCGGMQTIQTIFQMPKERLKFKFRPEDPNSIPLFSGRKTSTDLAVKVRRKKKADGTYEYKFDTVGVIDTTFNFEDKICDLQLLPTSSDIRNELLKSDFILNCDPNLSYADDESNTILKHFFYSRFTSPKSLIHEMNEQSKRVQHITNQDMICQLRKSRRMFGMYIKWEEDGVPTVLPDDYLSRIHPATFNDPVTLHVKELLEQRPMWSRHALLLLTKSRYTKLKYILPIHAFCYVNGPFRNLWVRYGYNAKIDKSSKIYQSIDCRYRGTSEALRNRITLFKDHSISYKSDFVSPFHYIDESVVGESAKLKSNDAGEDDTTENDYIFRPGQISIFKRTLYQLCDIEIDEVQAIVHANDGAESECTEKDGWCEKGAIEKIRKIMLSVANEMLQDPEIARKLSKQELSKLEIVEDDIEVTEVYDDLNLFDDMQDFLMFEAQQHEVLRQQLEEGEAMQNRQQEQK